MCPIRIIVALHHGIGLRIRLGQGQQIATVCLKQIVMKKLRSSLTIYFLLGCWSAWCGGGIPVSAVRIAGPSMTLEDDSVRIEAIIFPEALRVDRSQALTLRFTLESEARKVDLPSVVFSGSRRDRFDRRERLLASSPCDIPRDVYTKWQKEPGKTYSYRFSIPYTRWMRQAELKVTQVLSDCGDGRVLDRKVLLKGFDAGPDTDEPYTPVTAPPREQDTLQSVPPLLSIHSVDSALYRRTLRDLTPPADTLDVHSAKVTVCIDYPRGVARLIPDFGNNSRELEKVDSLFGFLLHNDRVRIEHISITGYASIEGSYVTNEDLARRRSFQFENFIREHYDLGDVPVSVQWVAEDWEGLRQQVQTSALPSKWEVLRIIDHTDIFEGREKMLMDLDWGIPYRLMLSMMFPSLRRIEMEVGYTVLQISAE